MTTKVQLRRVIDGGMEDVNPMTSEECVMLEDGKKLKEVVDFVATTEDFEDEDFIVEENLVDRVESIENRIDSEFEQQNSQIATGLSNIKTVEQNISNKVDTEVAKVNAQLSQVSINVKKYGAVGDGVTDDVIAIKNAIIEANKLNGLLFIPAGEYLISDEIYLPKYVECVGKIVGNVKLNCKKNAVVKNLSCTKLTISGVWRSEIDVNNADEILINGSSDIWGTFWNEITIKFTSTLIIDITNGAVNQNRFNGGRIGSLQITGDNSLHSTSECHDNIFIGFDISDGGAIQNDSKMQMNTLMHCYFEASGSKNLIQGNWNIIGFHGEKIPQLGINSQMLFSTNVWNNATQDFLSLTTNNLIEGGEWDVLNNKGYPIGFVPGNATAVVEYDETAPDGSNRKLHLTSTNSWSQITFILNKFNNFNGGISFFAKGNPVGMEWVKKDNSIAYTASTKIELNDGWSLYRISMPKDHLKYFRIFLTTTNNDSVDFYISGIKATQYKTVTLPSYNRNTIVRGKSTTMPTAGIWSVGEICMNSNIGSATTWGWVCTATEPLTFKALKFID